jgi:hypothetical protein
MIHACIVPAAKAGRPAAGDLFDPAAPASSNASLPSACRRWCAHLNLMARWDGYTRTGPTASPSCIAMHCMHVSISSCFFFMAPPADARAPPAALTTEPNSKCKFEFRVFFFLPGEPGRAGGSSGLKKTDQGRSTCHASTTPPVRWAAMAPHSLLYRLFP